MELIINLIERRSEARARNLAAPAGKGRGFASATRATRARARISRRPAKRVGSLDRCRGRRTSEQVALGLLACRRAWRYAPGLTRALCAPEACGL